LRLLLQLLDQLWLLLLSCCSSYCHPVTFVAALIWQPLGPWWWWWLLGTVILNVGNGAVSAATAIAAVSVVLVPLLLPAWLWQRMMAAAVVRLFQSALSV
jgi:hypothetical protein